MMTRKQVVVLVTLALGVFMGALDMSIVSRAFTTLQKTFGVPADTLTWALTLYTLVYVVSQPLCGRVSDLFGRKWIYTACVGLFGLGSLICGLSPALPVFLVGRAVQAGGAGPVPSSGWLALPRTPCCAKTARICQTKAQDSPRHIPLLTVQLSREAFFHRATVTRRDDHEQSRYPNNFERFVGRWNERRRGAASARRRLESRSRRAGDRRDHGY